MNRPGLPYKLVRHFEDRRDAHHLTFSCVDRKPLLASDDRKAMLCEAMSKALLWHECVVFAFVIMPEHVHMVVRANHDRPVISRLLYSIKQPVSQRVRRGSDVDGVPRFWQSGPGFDSNVRSWEDLLDVSRYVHLNPVRRGLVRCPEDYRWSSARQWLCPDDAVDPILPRVTRTRD